MSQPGSGESQPNPYASPLAESQSRPADWVADGDPRLAALRALVGPRWAYYHRAWQDRLEGVDKDRFNWAAFFFGGFWLPYRKMYRVTAIFYAILLAESFLEDAVFILGLGFEETPAAFQTAVSILVAMVCGTCGNLWYLRYAERKIADLRAQGLGGEELVSALQRQGGVSWVAGILGIVLLSAGVIALVVVIEWLLLL